MPSWELFEKQDTAYKASVLLPEVTARVSVEMASTFGWERYAGAKGKIIGMRTFGASAPLKDVLKRFGFTVESVVAAAKEAGGKCTGDENRDWVGPRWVRIEECDGRRATRA